MASIIRIKRSSVSGNPGTLAAGELAYSALSGLQTNGGERLYIGIGSETGGNAANHFVIGGKYFTDMMDHVQGTLTSGSAIITDSNNKIDVINVGGVTITGSTNVISSTNTNGDITLTPNGTGAVIVSTGKEFRVTDLTSSRVTFAGASGALKDSSSLTFNTGTNTLATVNVTATTNIIAGATVQGFDVKATSLTAGRVTFAGTNGLLIDASGLTYSTVTNKLTVTTGLQSGNIDITGNIISSQNTNGSITFLTTGSGKVSINGLYTLATTTGTSGYVLTTDGAGATSWQAASSKLSLAGDTSSTGTVDLLTGVLTFKGGTAISATVSGSTITYALSLATTSSVGISSFDGTDFSVSGAGAVTLQTERIEDITGAMVTGASSTQTNITVSYDDPSGKLLFTVNTATSSVLGVAKFSNSYYTVTNGDVEINDATSAAKGIAKFNSATFSVSSGDVTVKSGGITNAQLVNSTFTLGTSTYTLGNTSTIIAGLTQVNIGTTSSGLQFSGNEIRSVGTSTISIYPINSGTVNFNSSRLTNLLEPVDPQDAATKYYVDASRSGLDVKQSVRVATTGPITLSNIQTIDGVSLVAGDRVLVKDQASAAANGIYVVASGAWSRSTDADEPAEVTANMFFFVEEGTVNSDSGWVLTSNNPLTIGTDPLVFSQFSGAGSIIAGDGLSKTGNTLSVNVANGIEIASDNVQLASTVAGDGLTYASGVLNVVGTTNRISVSVNAIDIDANYAGQTTITTLGIITSGTWQSTIIGTSYGGTGFSTYAGYDLLVGNIGGSLSKLTLGSAGQVLQVNTSGNALVYADLDGGTY